MVHIGTFLSLYFVPNLHTLHACTMYIPLKVAPLYRLHIFFKCTVLFAASCHRPSSSCHPPSHLDLLHQSLVSFNKNQKQSDTGIILPVLSATRATQGLLPLFFPTTSFIAGLSLTLHPIFFAAFVARIFR
ncbi:hypothetical protein F4815DRAFT_209327 [Daldinia loculata]|nr:hypothetical protein F4815DRAFT_209327 [Daldinia loculata]